MQVIKQVALLTTGLGLVLGASVPAHAELGHYISSNAVDKCQAFTPGVTNTIRNRVIGAQNVGTATIAVACVFELDEVYGGSSVITDNIYINVSNGGSSAVSVSCTLLPGESGDIGTAVSQTLSVDPGSTTMFAFDGPYNVFGIGVNCNLPPNVTIGTTTIRYRNDET